MKEIKITSKYPLISRWINFNLCFTHFYFFPILTKEVKFFDFNETLYICRLLSEILAVKIMPLRNEKFALLNKSGRFSLFFFWNEIHSKRIKFYFRKE